MQSSPGCGPSLADDTVFCPTCGWQKSAATTQDATAGAPATSAAAPAGIEPTAPSATRGPGSRSDVSGARKTLGYVAFPACIALLFFARELALHRLPGWSRQLLANEGADLLFFLVCLTISISVSELIYPHAGRVLDNLWFAGPSGRRFGWRDNWPPLEVVLEMMLWVIIVVFAVVTMGIILLAD